jgi:DNA-binding response OmpR family regulator
MAEPRTTQAWQAQRIEFLEQEVAELRKRLGEDRLEEIATLLHTRLSMPPAVARIAAALYVHTPHRPASKPFLCEVIGTDSEVDKVIDVHVCRLRRALGKEAVETVWKSGFMMTRLGRLRVEAVLLSAVIEKHERAL